MRPLFLAIACLLLPIGQPARAVPPDDYTLFVSGLSRAERQAWDIWVATAISLDKKRKTPFEFRYQLLDFIRTRNSIQGVQARSYVRDRCTLVDVVADAVAFKVKINREIACYTRKKGKRQACEAEANRWSECLNLVNSVK